MNEELNENVEDQVQEDAQDQKQEEAPSYSMRENGDFVINTKKEDAVQEQGSESLPVGEQAGDSEEVDGSVRLGDIQEPEAEQKEEEVVELGQVVEDVEPEATEEPSESKEEEFELPEAFGKMIDFLKKNPGATPEDYVNIQKGADLYSDEDLLKQKLAKENGLDLKEDVEEINFLYEDKFGFDEDLDEDRAIKLKKVEFKKSLKEAKTDLAKQQEEYLGNLTFKDQSPEVKEALKFQKQAKESESARNAVRESFLNNTDKLFSEDFKGFEFKYGENKSQKIKVGKVSEVKNFQSDVNNFFNKHVGEDGAINNVESYHKSLWAAENVDAIVSHFYEQGRADAVRDSAKKAKNIDMGSRQDVGAISDDTNKPKFRLVDSDSDSNFKFKR